MIVQPNGNIKLLKNIPIDSNYEHTLYFQNKEAQESYFNTPSLIQKVFTAQSYTRVNKGVIRVNCVADEVYNCNYLCFQNNGFLSSTFNKGKWFYAFITRVDYHNNSTTEIEYTIDVIQTYMFDYTLKQCYVEREHSIHNSIIYDHEVEPVVPNRIVEDVTQHVPEGSHECGFLCTEVPDAVRNYLPEGVEIIEGGSNNIFNGLILICGMNTTAKINDVLEHFADSADVDVNTAIVTMFQYPTKYAENIGQYDSVYTLPHIVNLPTTVNGYPPKNKKLLTYPYSFLRLLSPTGEYVDLNYEWFSDVIGGGTSVEIIEYGCVYPTPDAMCVPENYNYSGETKPQFSNALHLNCSTDVAYKADGYANWLSSNRISTALTFLKGASIGFSDIESGAFTIGEAYSSKFKANALSDPALGGLSHNVINTAVGNNGFYIKKMCVESEEAIQIDDFFTKYGYRCNQVKVPNINARPRWNYVKTKDCLIVGELPVEASREICTAFNNGITFWKNATEVGNYSLDNSPT